MVRSLIDHHIAENEDLSQTDPMDPMVSGFDEIRASGCNISVTSICD